MGKLRKILFIISIVSAGISLLAGLAIGGFYLYLFIAGVKSTGGILAGLIGGARG